VVIIFVTAGRRVAARRVVDAEGTAGKTVHVPVLVLVATGLSWLCYYRALQLVPASLVARIDKLSVPLQ
jgi:bacterial/archaeal transporter family protein